MVSNSQSSNTYKLFYIIGKSKTNAFLIDSENQNILTSKEIRTSEEELIAYCNSTNPSTVYLFEDNSEFSLLPLDYFVYGKENAFAQVGYPEVSELIATNRSFDDQVSVVYNSISLIEKLSFQFEVSSFHLSTPLINMALRPAKLCILYFSNDHMYLTLGIDHLLKIHNRYAIQKPDDVIYFLSKAIELYEYDGQIIVGGNILESSQIGHKIRSQFNQVSFYSDNLDESRLLFLQQS